MDDSAETTLAVLVDPHRCTMDRQGSAASYSTLDVARSNSACGTGGALKDSSSFSVRATLSLLSQPPEPPTSRRAEFSVLFALAWPTIVQTASQQAMMFTDQVFLGHLGTLEFAAAALGSTYASFFIYFLFGVTTALDTLGAQAYGAQKQGIKGTSLAAWTCTSAVVMTLMCLPAMVGLALGAPFATVVLGQGPQVANLMSVFCVGLIPGILPLMWAMVLMKHLQVQNVVLGPALVTVMTFLLNIASNFIFIHLMGFKGAPLATSFSRFVQFFVMAGMVAWHERCRHVHDAGWLARFLFQGADKGEPSLSDACSSSTVDVDVTVVNEQGCLPLETHAPQQAASVKEAIASAVRQCKHTVQLPLVWAYLKLGIPGGVMMSCEAAGFDMTTAMAGRLGPTAVSAHSAVLAISTLSFMSCPLAVGIAGSIRVGNLLGAGRPAAARLASWLCVGIGGGFMAVSAATILATKDFIGHVFTSDPEVITMMAAIAPISALFQVTDGLMGTSQGVLRGCGKQRLLMVYNFVGFWVCGLLLGYLLCFKAGLGLAGLWWGIASGDTVTSALNLVTLAFVRWDKESQAALAHVRIASDASDANGDGDTDAEECASLLARHVESKERGEAGSGVYQAVPSSKAYSDWKLQAGP